MNLKNNKNKVKTNKPRKGKQRVSGDNALKHGSLFNLLLGPYLVSWSPVDRLPSQSWASRVRGDTPGLGPLQKQVPAEWPHSFSVLPHPHPHPQQATLETHSWKTGGSKMSFSGEGPRVAQPKGHTQTGSPWWCCWFMRAFWAPGQVCKSQIRRHTPV